MNKTLVTGCSGFIGKHLVRLLLSKGYEVIGIDINHCPIEQNGFQFLVCDIRNELSVSNLFKEHAFDTVFHLAARTDLDGKDLASYSANSIGVENLINGIKASKSVKRCIYTSSQLVCRVGYIPRDDLDFCPDTLYGQSKVMTEQIVREYNGGGKEWCIVRPTTVWGPGMSRHYQRFFKLIKAGKYIHVGNKPLYKSYGYVGNTIYQYVKLITAPVNLIQEQIFYMADYQPLSLRDWVNQLQSEMGARPVIAVPELPVRLAALLGDTANVLGFHNFPYNSFRLRNVLTEYQFNLENTQRVCGLLPYTIGDGVKETVRWLFQDKILE